jgi:type I restriction enzyme S subunit
MRRYDSYKDSGVEWIGEIPSEWECIRLGMLGNFSSSGIDKKLEDNEHPVRMVNFTDLIQSRKYFPIQTGEKDYMKVTTPYSKFVEHKLNKGDMVFIPSSETHEDLGYSSLIDFDEDDVVYSYHILRFRTNREIYHYFKKYLVNHHSVLNQFSSEGKGTTRQIIGRNVFNNVRVILPPLSEQQQIVSFLDTKTSLIDSLIEKTQRKIELLKENRTSLINEVVTKGLNPNVEMKDSGVEWIGEIPSHWELRKGSTIGNYSKGNGIKKDEVKETGLPCIRYGEIYTKYNHKFERVKTFIDEGITDVKVSSGTLFMTGSGELLEEIGKCVVYVGKEELYVGGDIIILKPFSEFDSEFLSYQINSECIRIQRELNGRGGIIVHIYSKNFKDMWFPTPSLSEQQQIVSYLDEHTQLIDKTISVEERRIDTLKEYRQSLISEVVTGKRKVID